MRRTCLGIRRGHGVGEGRGRWRSATLPGFKQGESVRRLAAHALTAVTVPRASSEAVLWHISTAIEKPGGMCHAFARREPSVTSIASTAHGGRS